MSLNQTDQNQIRVRTDQKQQERFKTSSNNLNDSSNRRSMKCLKCLRNESDRQTDWIDCKKCSNLYHWCCVSKNILDPIDIVDKWYCDQCLRLNQGLKCVYRKAPRKSNRSSSKASKINYSDSNLDDPSRNDPDRFINLAKSKSNVFDATDSKQIGAHKPFRRVRGDELSLEWLLRDEGAMMEPIIIEDSDCLNSLGMRMPKSDLTIREISDIVGPKTPVEVMDVASQSELSRWTLDDWATYFEQPNRDRIRNVISLEVSETELGKMIQLPRIVRQMDWVQTIWPDELKVHGSLNYPKVQKYCLMSVARCWTDWHVDFAGSSVFYHILRGMKVFYFIRPTVANLSKYEKWSGNSELQESTWLGDQVNVVYKVTLQAGDTMIIPTGWIHAVYTPTDSLVFGGNYLHSLNIPTQLRIHQIENNTKVPKKFRFPFFSSSLWLVANHYLNRLKRRTMENDKKQDLDNQTQGHKDLDNVEVIPDRVLSGLLTLSGFLIDQSEGVGTDVKDSLSFLEARSIIKENLNCDQQLNSKLYPIAHELNRLVKLSLKKLPTPSSQSTSSSVSAAPATTTTTTTTKPNGLLIHLKRKASQNEKERSKSTNDAAEAQATAQNGSSKKIKITQSNPTRNSINNKNNSSNTNGKKDLGEIIFRSNEVPSTKVEIQRRKVPNYDADWEKKENEEVRADGEEEDVEGVEVRTTGAQNKVVRRYLDDDGRMVFETRTVNTVIEKAIFPKTK